MRKILIAGVGNHLYGDDGFGPEVARRLAAGELPEGVRAVDFGIRNLNLAYDMLAGSYDTTILIDAVPRNEPAGTLYVMQPEVELAAASPAVNGSSINPQTVFSFFKSLGGNPGRVLIVGCEPKSLEEGSGLSEDVRAAADEAVVMIREIVDRELSQAVGASGEPAVAE